MTNYNWIILQLDTAPQDGDLQDVVKVVHWRYTGSTEVNDETFATEIYQAYSCPQPSETDFTAYPDLTKEQVVSWLEDAYDVASLKAQIDAQLETLINPPIVHLPLPWSETESENSI